MDAEDELPTLHPLPASNEPPPDDSRTLDLPASDSLADAPTLQEPPPPSGSAGPSDPPTGADGSGPGSRPGSRLRGSSRLPSTAGPGARAGLTGGAVFAGRYEVLSEIARGGMGVVYKARHVHLGTVVALKVMLAGTYATDEACRRFILEAEASARLKHPHIVPVHDIGEDDGQLYFTMDFVDGAPLSKRKAELPRPKLLEVMIKATGAVAYAHQRGIIHRDLKPANIMMTAADEPMIMDFGLAKQVALTDEEGRPSLQTREGAIMGTPQYMPPEQAEGLVSEVDVRSDVYALGVILYELFTGRLPFEGRSVSELLLKIFEHDPAPPRQVDPTIDPDLEAIILKAMDKEKARRYESAADLQRELERLRDGMPVQARRAGAVYRARKWLRRHRGAVAAGSALALVLTASTAALVHQRREAAMAAERERAGRRADAARAQDELGAALPPLEARLAAAARADDADDGPLRALRADVAPLASEAARHVARLEDDPLGAGERAALQRLSGRLADLDRAAARALEVRREAAAATAALEQVRALRALVEQRLAAQAQQVDAAAAPTTLDAALAAWADLPAALPREVRDDDPAFAAVRPALERASGHVFTLLNLTPEGSPTRARAARLVEELATLRRDLDEAARSAERTRLALRLRHAARALLDLLSGPHGGAPERARAGLAGGTQGGSADDSSSREAGERSRRTHHTDDRDLSTPEARARLLRGARLSQALVQRSTELAPAADGAGELAALKRESARVYAEVLLDLNAYEVFDAELEGLHEEDRAALRDQRAAAEQVNEVRAARIAAASQVRDRTRAQLDEQRAELEALAAARLPAELDLARREAQAAVAAAITRLAREEVYRAIDAAEARARDPGAEARAELAEQADAQLVEATALLEANAAAFAADPRVRAEQAARCADARVALLLRAARAARDRGELGPAATFARRALAALEALPGRDADARAAADLLVSLERERGTPEGMVLLPGGVLEREDGTTLEVAPFYLARREVTHAEFAAVMGTTPPPGREDLPVTGVTFDEARRFAAAVGRRLPTDAEWELAARQHGERRTEFPWGDRFEDGRLAAALLAPGANLADVTPEGIFDLGGNVSEWVVLSAGHGADGAVEPAIRGGSFLYPLRRVARGVYRMSQRVDDYRGPQLGLRLAKDATSR